MKKCIILILAIFLLGISGCKPDEKEVINQFDVDNVNELIDLIPDEVTEKDRPLIIAIREAYDALNDLEKELILEYEKLEYAESVLAAIDLEKERLDAARKALKQILIDLETELDELIPDEVSDNVKLPTEINHEKGCIEIIWRSTDPFTFATGGVVIPGRKDINVRVTAELKIFPHDPEAPQDVKHFFEQNVIVKGITFKPLPKRNLTFAYSYNANGFTDEAIETIDVVNHAFSSVINGVVSVGGSGRQDLLELRKKGVRVVLCIGGYGDNAKPISLAVSTDEGRTKLIKTIVDAIQKYHFDGVDIDWEYPGVFPGDGVSASEDMENYLLFMEELRRQVKLYDEDYLVTAALPGGPYTVHNYNISKLNDILDYFLLMTYDMHHNNLTTFHTALYPSSFTVKGNSVKETIDWYILEGASLNKLVVGAAFYGRRFKLDYEGAPQGQEGAIYEDSIEYKTIKKNYLNRVDTGEVISCWNDEAKAPYLYEESTKTFITYDDPESIKYKIEYIKNEKLAGIMFWEFTQDNGELIAAIKKYM